MTVSPILRLLPEYLFDMPRNRLLLLLLAFAAVVIFTGIGLRSPWPADEPRFAEVAREMVASGQWLIPMRGGEFYPDKPPVFMWSIALFYWLTGNLKVAFLLPSALCSLLTLGLVFDIGTRLWNQRTGAIALLLLMLAPQFVIQAQKAQIDATAACWITVACYGLLRHFFAGPAWGWYFTAWGFMGLGIVTKGVGFLPALMLIPILVMKFRDGARFSDTLTWRCALGPLAMFAVVAAWLIPMVMYVDALGTDEALAYRNNILFKQTGERYLDSWGHIHPWHYYLTNVIPALWFPLPLLLLALFRPLADAIRHRPVIPVLLVWIALVILFFSFSPGKRGVYLLPALPMLALILAPLLSSQRPAGWFPPLLTGVHLLMAAVLIAVGLLAWNDHPNLVKKFSAYSHDPARLHEAGTLVFTLGLAWLTSLVGFWRSRALGRVFMAMMVSWLLLATWGYRILEPLRTPRNILATAETSLPADAELGMIDSREQYILFSKLDFTHFSFFSNLRQEGRNAWLWMSEADNRYVIVSDDHDLDCFRLEGALHLGVAHRDNLYLLGLDQMEPSCPAPKTVTRYTTRNPGNWM